MKVLLSFLLFFISGTDGRGGGRGGGGGRGRGGGSKGGGVKGGTGSGFSTVGKPSSKFYSSNMKYPGK